tara:strand:+ start:408 stop:548 length:141 start_codon:yes stop_codon:yes gene_type:complete
MILIHNLIRGIDQIHDTTSKFSYKDYAPSKTGSFIGTACVKVLIQV